MFQSCWVSDDIDIVVDEDGSEVFAVVTIAITWHIKRGGKAMDQDGVSLWDIHELLRELWDPFVGGVYEQTAPRFRVRGNP